MAAVAKNGHTIQFASAALQKDKGIALAAVEQNGSALCSCSEDVKDDRDIVVAAIAKEHGRALKSEGLEWLRASQTRKKSASR